MKIKVVFLVVPFLIISLSSSELSNTLSTPHTPDEDFYLTDARQKGNRIVEFTDTVCNSSELDQIRHLSISLLDTLSYEQVYYLSQIEQKTPVKNLIFIIASYNNNHALLDYWKKFSSTYNERGIQLYNDWCESLEKLVPSSFDYNHKYDKISTHCRRLYAQALRVPLNEALQKNLASKTSKSGS